MSNFNFEAPQFINFCNFHDDTKADQFFDVSNKEQNGESYSIKEKKLFAQEYSQCDNEDSIRTRELSSSKENVEPQCRGQGTFHSKTNKDLEKQINEFEVKLRSSSSNSDDPLADWCAYIHWIEQSFPREERKLKLKDVLKRCLNKFKDCEKYVNDMRFLQLSIKYDSFDNLVSSTSSIKCNSLKKNKSVLGPAKKFVSLAEQVELFYKETPERYRYKVAKPTKPTTSNCCPREKYVPKSPNLITKHRLKKVTYPNEKQREEMELEEMKKYKFKARPLNKKILMEPCLNLKAPVLKKPPTVPQPFSLTEVKKKDPPPEPVFQFKAQPIPSNILSGPVGVPRRKVVSPTIPITPKFKTLSRSRVLESSVLNF